MSALEGLLHNLDLLRCPVCEGSFTHDDGSVRCAEGHNFDIAREGYLNLTRSSKKASDTVDMVKARERVFFSGVFDPAVHAVVELAAEAQVVADIGCGPGFHLGALRDSGAVDRLVGVDLSKPAVRAASKRIPHAALVVADVTQDLPLADASFDAVLSILAPRPVAEFRRILAPGGRLLVVAAGPDHLVEVRRELDLLNVPQDKEGRVRAQLETLFDVVSTERISYIIELSRRGILDIVTMGPNYWHSNEEKAPRGESARAITMDFVVLAGSGPGRG